MIREFERKEGRYYLRLDTNRGILQEKDVHKIMLRMGLIRENTLLNAHFPSPTEVIVELKAKSGRILTQQELCDLELDIHREEGAKRSWRLTQVGRWT